MSVLHIKLLGGFSVTFDDSPVTGLHQPRLQSFLAYLLLNRHAPQSRQSIAFLFWPDSTEKQSRNNLHSLIFSLRRALPQADLYLDVTTETIAWQMGSPYELDVSQIETWSESVSEGGPAMALQLTMAKITTVYPGELLPGFYEEWILNERDRLHSPYVRQLRDAKIKPVITVMKPLNLHNYAKLCGEALAHAHSRSGDAMVLAAYMGENSTFADAIAQFALAYADQNDRDYDVMIQAVRDGRIEVQLEE